MKIYLIERGVDYEGSEILAAYLNLDKAEAHLEELEKEDVAPWIHFVIVEIDTED